jgi:uncharacterized repeat protein (TIGR03803 family)
MAVAGTFLCCFCQHLQAQRALQRVYSGAVGGYLIEATNGFFYGSDASSSNLFKFRPDGAYQSLAHPVSLNAEITLADDGNIYGTTRKGGAGYGSIFQLTPGGQFTEVYSFSAPFIGPGGLRKGIDGALYGFTGSSAPLYAPQPTSIFQFTTNGVFTTLHGATNVPPGFNSSPVQAADGTLYGTAEYDINNFSFNTRETSIYKLSASGAYTVLYRITNATSSGLIFGPDGALYGTLGGLAPYRGTPAEGAIFRITTNGQFTQILTFAQTNGSDPAARLLLASDSYLYGTTTLGGISNSGTIFRIDTSGQLEKLADFTDANYNGPDAPLIEASDGNLYGTTDGGPPYSPGAGSIFRLVPPPVITALDISGGATTLAWTSFTNGIYRVDYKSSLSIALWTTLVPRVTAADSTVSISASPPRVPQQFYRVTLLP